MQHEYDLKKLNLDLLTLSQGPGGGEGLGAKYLIPYFAAFVIPFNLIMQHDHILTKLNFDLLTPRVRVVEVCGQNSCYHVAAHVI